VAALALLGVVGFGGLYAYRASRVIAPYAAKQICSGVFISGLPAERVVAVELHRVRWALRYEIDREARTVTTRIGPFAEARAVYRPGLGATLVVGRSEADLRAEEVLAPAPRSAAAMAALAARPWPDGDGGATLDPAAAGLDAKRLADAVDLAFHEPDAASPTMHTRAFLVVFRGRIVAERYAEGIRADMPLIGWSMTKSVTGALVGILVGQGRTRVEDPIALPAWSGSGDRRATIPLDAFLRMASGLEFEEQYFLPWGDPVQMLFRNASTADYAAAKPLEHDPDQVCSYASGTTNLICRAIERVFAEDRAAYWRFPREALFDRIGMRSAVMEPDPAGTFVGSSFCYATPRDWARFGLLYLWDGVWKGGGEGAAAAGAPARILPEGWVAYSRKPHPKAKQGRYGVHFWLNAGTPGNPADRTFPKLPTDVYFARGFHEQMLAIFPSHDLVVVRQGVTEWPAEWPLERVLEGVLEALPRAEPTAAAGSRREGA
jgi:hypothetical protein